MTIARRVLIATLTIATVLFGGAAVAQADSISPGPSDWNDISPFGPHEWDDIAPFGPHEWDDIAPFGPHEWDDIAPFSPTDW